MSQPENGRVAPPTDQDFADRLLIQDCMAGKDAAWRQLNERIGQRMRALALGKLRGERRNKTLIEELAADLLTSFFLNRDLLQAHLRFGRNLNRYLDFLISRAIRSHYKNLGRHKRHEAHLCDAQLADLRGTCLPADLMPELFEILTPAENKYLLWIFHGDPLSGPSCPLRRAYARQLEHRIALKVRRLLMRGG